jgi:hypothetical protein
MDAPSNDLVARRIVTYFAIELVQAAFNNYGRTYSGQPPTADMESIDEK